MPVGPDAPTLLLHGQSQKIGLRIEGIWSAVGACELPLWVKGRRISSDKSLTRLHHPHRSRSLAWHHRGGSPVRASVRPQLRPGLDPRPAGGAAFLAAPAIPFERAGRWQHVKVALCARHLPGTGMARRFDRFACAFVVRTVRPRTRQLAMLVMMLRANLHFTIHVTAEPVAACSRSAPPDPRADTPDTGQT